MNNTTMKKKWIEDVKAYIPVEWQFLSTMCHPKCETKYLDSVLIKLYQKHLPRKNGLWDVAPKWTEMFQWTSCPLKGVRAIILIMEPLQPSKSNKKGGGYKSTGYALGVKQENSDDSADISQISAVWNFLKILHKLFGKEFIEEDMKRKFQEGFGPEILSKKGILFLNMALTRGNGGKKRDTDIDIWMGYTIEVLREIGERNQDVLIFQFYNKKEIENF
jgi:uracil DNA glycosylase